MIASVRAQRRSTKVALAAASLALSLAAAELALRVASPPATYPSQLPLLTTLSANLDLIYELVPNSEARSSAAGAPTITYRTNALGLRGSEPIWPKPRGRFRILALGDSQTFGFEVEEHDALPAQLERHLTSASAVAERLEVFNAGVPSYNTWQEMVWLRDRGLALDPDLVLLQIDSNDVLYPLGVLLNYSELDVAVPLPPGYFPDPAYATSFSIPRRVQSPGLRE